MGNIIGEGFDPFVVGQIKKRQEIYGLANRTTDSIKYTNANSAWIKISSAVNIDASISTKLGTQFSDNDLARANVLFGGIGTIDGKDIKGGFTNALNFTTQGYRPNPGIIAFETKNKNRGSLREGTVSIKCFDTEQFNVLDTLYLRLGYGVLIEWGHTLYYGNDGGLIEKTDTDNITNRFLNGTFNDNPDLLRETILNKREATSGNYDAFYARIVNFDWTYESDGTYNINLKLISWGDVIESLKVNTLKNGVTTPQSDEEKKEQDKKIQNADAAVDLDLIKYSKDKSKIHYDLYQSAIQNKTLGTSKDGIKSSNDSLNYWESKDDFVSYKEYTGIDDIRYFVRLGGFIHYLNERCLLYGKNGKNLLKIDNSSENYIFTTPNVLSSNPRDCIVKVNISTSSKDVSIFKGLPKTFTETISDVFVGNLMNVYISARHIVKVLNENEDEKGNVDLFTLLKKISELINSSLGGLNNIEPVIDETENRIYFVDETSIPNRDKILKGLDKSTELAKFALYGFKPENSSFIYNFGIKTEITNELATILSIGAQSNGVAVGEDATAFSVWNKGLTDRVIPEKVDYEKSNQKPETPIDYSQIELNYSNFLYEIEAVNTEDAKFDDDIDSFSSQLKEYLNYQQSSKSMIDKTASGTIGFIPLSLNLSMVGLSGMKIYQKYSIDSYFLPTTYPETIEFLVKGITQKIEGNKWTTTIDGFSIPANTTEANTKKIQYNQPATNVTQASGSGNGGGTPVQPTGFTSNANVATILGVTRGQCGIPTENPKVPIISIPTNKDGKISTVRQDAMTKAHTEMFSKGENTGDPHLCGRWTYNMAINYTNLLRGKPAILNKTNILSAGGNANSIGYWNNLVNLGYTQNKVAINVTKNTLINLLQSSNYQPGDVVVYWDNINTSKSFGKYGHTQIYLDNGSWATDKKYNYGSKTSPKSFIYNSASSGLNTCWNLYVFKAPLGNSSSTPESDNSRQLYEDYVKILIKVLQRKDLVYLKDTTGNGIPLIGSLVGTPGILRRGKDDEKAIVGRLKALFGYTSQTINGKPVVWNNNVPHTSLSPDHQKTFKYYFNKVIQAIQAESPQVDFLIPSKTDPTKTDSKNYYLVRTDLTETNWVGPQTKR